MFENQVLQKIENGRSLPASQMLARLNKIKVRTGISRVANITGLDDLGVSTYAAIRPNAKSYAVTQGKGGNDTIAQLSAIMESLELYHSENLQVGVFEKSYKEVLTHKTCINLNETSKKLDVKIDIDHKTKWTSSINLINGEEKLVPYEIVNFDLTTNNKKYFNVDTSGLAGAHTKEEAIIKGILECIERDGMACWVIASETWKSKRHIDISTINSIKAQELIQQLERNLDSIHIWDITTDTNIPTFLTYLLPKNYETYETRLVYGTSSALDKEDALLGSIYEAAQSRLTFISGARDDQTLAIYKNKLSINNKDKADDFFSFKSSKRDYRDLKSYQNGNILDDLITLKKNLKHIGANEVCYIDLTLPDIGIPFCKIVIPTLMNMSFLKTGTMSSRTKKFLKVAQNER